MKRIIFRSQKNKVNNFTHPPSSNRLGYPFAYIRTTHTTIVPKSMNRCVRTLDEPRYAIMHIQGQTLIMQLP